MQPTTRPPLELNDADSNKGVEAARKLLQAHRLAETDENLFIVATCKEKGLAFLKGDATLGVRKIEKENASTPSGEGLGDFALRIGGKLFDVRVDGQRVTVDGQAYDVDLVDRADVNKAGVEGPTPSDDTTDITSQMPGVVLRVFVQPGDHIRADEPILVLEAMKMEVRVTAPKDGVVRSIEVKVGQQVANGQRLARLG
jgi:pyruvate carboxylase subunit B